MPSFSIAIMGRPNVGKSTLFNRLAGKKLAIVDDMPGVTRDRREADAKLGDMSFKITDTAGLDQDPEDALSAQMWNQTARAVTDANLILFLVDGREGVLPLDEHYATMIRRAGKPVVLVANKCEGYIPVEHLAEASAMGFGEPVCISAEHGQGMAQLFQAVVAYEQAAELTDTTTKDLTEESSPRTPSLHLAIVGRPNAGKSTLVNQLLKEERVITSDIAGTTRDAIAIDWTYKDRHLKLIDTAGIRKRSKVTLDLEKYAVSDALRTVKYAQLVILVLDPESPLSKQDLTIASRVIEEGRVLMIALNKWDKVKDKKKVLDGVHDRLKKTLSQTKDIPCVPISAKTGKNLDKMMEMVFSLYEHWNVRIPTAELNKWLENIIAYHPPPLSGGKRINIKYMTQVKTRPPGFALFLSKPTEVPASYLRYLTNALRDDFDLPGIPLRLMVRKGKNPYAKEGK